MSHHPKSGVIHERSATTKPPRTAFRVLSALRFAFSIVQLAAIGLAAPQRDAAGRRHSLGGLPGRADRLQPRDLFLHVMVKVNNS